MGNMEYYNGLKIRHTHDFMVPVQTTNPITSL